ncbi:MAG: isochorismatase family protein [Candidatus Melainabacteria bacterium]|nr:isochorismatase family protein [Candidatus Melainabacteria bacterium]
MALTELSPNQCLLVSMDLQPSLIKVLHHSERLIYQVSGLIQTAIQLKIPCWLTEQVPEKLGSTIEAIQSRLSGEQIRIFQKSAFGLCADSAINDALQQLEPERRQILLTGAESHICIRQSALQLKRQGFQPWVVVDAISSRCEKEHHWAVQAFLSEKIPIISTESLLFEWLQTADHPQFKAVQAFIKGKEW